MDAFYASVEQRDNPELKGKPVVVGGPPNSRGVVAACSYEARSFGIHSAMPSSRAVRLCPQAFFVPPRFPVYSEISRQIRAIFHEYSKLVEPLSLDEAFIDVTENMKGLNSATQIAREIRREIFRKTGLTASAGVSFNKFLAKVASDINKPDGLAVITPRTADRFIDALPIGKFFGVGRVTQQRMVNLGIHTGADLKKREKTWLLDYFGKAGAYFYDIAHGLDERAVNPHRERKSLGKERTFSKDITDSAEMMEVLSRLAVMVEEELNKKHLSGYTLTLKVKYYDFSQVTRSKTGEQPLKRAVDLIETARELLKTTEAGSRPVRLLGITVSNFCRPARVEAPSGQKPLPFQDCP